MSNRKESKIIPAWMFYICILAASLWMASCTTLKKATRYFDTHPDAAAHYFKDKNPIVDSVGLPVFDTIKSNNEDFTQIIDSIQGYINDLTFDSLKGDNPLMLRGGTYPGGALVYVDTDGIITWHKVKEHVNKLANNYKPCKPDTIRMKIPIYQENKFKTRALQSDIYEAGEKLEKAQSTLDKRTLQRDKWRKIAMIFIGITALLLIYIFRKPIANLALKLLSPISRIYPF